MSTGGERQFRRAAAFRYNPGVPELSPSTSVEFLRTVGPQRAALLSRLGIFTVEDLLLFMPRDVLDLTKTTRIEGLIEGTVQTVRGVVVDRDSRVSRGRSMVGILLKADGGYLRCVWFNQPYMFRKYEPDAVLLVTGQPKLRDGRWEISHPQIQRLEQDDQQAGPGILPRYPLTEGISMHEMRRMTRAAAEDCADLMTDPIPSSFRTTHQWPSRAEACRGLHAAASVEEYERSRKRLLLDDLLEFQLGLAQRRRLRLEQQTSVPLPADARIQARIARLFPFEWTAGQKQGLAEILGDLARPRPMHRLLQADVGAGKTAVAIAAMLVAVANKKQAVLMAPTEVLARQHFETLEKLLAESSVERRLLAGSIAPAQRKMTLAEIESGRAQIIVGTQALIQESVRFHELGLVVIDEQHKFGVEQRARFTQGAVVPHLLVMTATPIPRTLCLTAFGDLDITIIRDLPPGRQPVSTHVVTDAASAKKAWDFVRTKLGERRQAYVICPRVEAASSVEASPTNSEAPISGSKIDTGKTWSSAETLYERLRTRELVDFRVGLLHGRLSTEARSEVMDQFRQHELDVLVATSVIEVGVDVPTATQMIVYHAEQFGLSQLHQFRGRVGRGKVQGFCFLFTKSPDPDAPSRLKTLEQTTDGFAVAEADFQLRGHGDVLGTRQHGQTSLKRADLIRDAQLVETARALASSIIDSGQFDTPEFLTLRRLVHERFNKLEETTQAG